MKYSTILLLSINILFLCTLHILVVIESHINIIRNVWRKLWSVPYWVFGCFGFFADSISVGVVLLDLSGVKDDFFKKNLAYISSLLVGLIFRAINIISVLIITSGSTVQYIFGQYYYILANHNGVSVFPTLWIATGCFLLVVSIFGILVSSGESTVLINTYAILLSMVLIMHVATAIAGLMLGVCRSKEIVSETLTAFMHSYDYDTVLRETMDWTQLKYHCCGNNGPDDWLNYSKSAEASEILSTTQDENNTSTLADPIDSTMKAMPASCCIRDSDYKNYRCDKYYTNGCFTSVQEVISANVMIASFLALGMALFDLLGAVIAFLITKTIRREREIETDYSQLGIKSSYR